MKRLILFFILLLICIPTSITLASDVSNAEYITTISVTNNSSSLVNSSVTTFDLSTDDCIDSGLMDSTATDIGMLHSGGIDIAVMPGYDTNPWCFFVSTIDALSSSNYYLYSGGVTGGKIRYFPENNGMVVADASNIELSDNGTITASCYVDTTANNTGSIIWKQDAYGLYKSTSQNGTYTASIFGSPSSVYPTSYTDPNADWTDETLAYDNNFTTVAYSTGGAGTYELILTRAAAVNVERISLYWYSVNGITNLDLDVYHDGAWHDLYNGSSVSVGWNYYDLYGLADVTSIKIGVTMSTSSALLSEARFVQAGISKYVEVAGLSSGEKVVTFSTNTTDLILDFDGSSNTTALSGASVPNNSNDLNMFHHESTPYAEYAEISVGGVDISRWEWEYGSTFYDSINNNNATPDFKTTDSNENVFAEIINQESTAEQGKALSATTTGFLLYEEVPDQPEGLFDEGSIDFPGGPEIDQFATDSRIMTTTGLLYVLALISAGVIGLLVFAATHKTKQGIRGSLFLMFLTMEGVLTIWVFGGGGVISGFILIPFGILAILTLMINNPQSPLVN